MQAAPKRGDFVRPNAFVVVDGDGSLWHNMRLPSFQTRPTMRRIWSEMFLKPENNTVWKLWQLSIIYLSRIIMILTVKTTGKSRGKSATTQIRHNRRIRCYCFFCHVISRAFVLVALDDRRQSEDHSSTARRNAECTSETKPQGIAFIMGRTRAFNLEIHCAIAPRCIARLVFLSLASLARAIIMMSRFDCCLVGGLKQLDMQDFRCHTL